MACLDNFVLRKSNIIAPGGNKSPIAIELDNYLQNVCGGWRETDFDIQVVVDNNATRQPSHKIDNFKNRIGIEVEWNNKDPFFDRDLNNFRLLWQFDVVSVGIIVTRLWELQKVFNLLGKGKSYGMATTHWGKLIPKVDGGGGGGCPLLLVGIGTACYDPHS